MTEPKEIKVNVMGEIVTILDYGDGRFLSKGGGGGFDTPENRAIHIAQAHAIELLVAAYKRGPKVFANRKNAAKPRKSRLENPTPEQVVETMKDLGIVNQRGEMQMSEYRKALLKKIKKSYPAINTSSLDRRLEAARNRHLIKPI